MPVAQVQPVGFENWWEETPTNTYDPVRDRPGGWWNDEPGLGQPFVDESTLLDLITGGASRLGKAALRYGAAPAAAGFVKPIGHAAEAMWREAIRHTPERARAFLRFLDRSPRQLNVRATMPQFLREQMHAAYASPIVDPRGPATVLRTQKLPTLPPPKDFLEMMKRQLPGGPDTIEALAGRETYPLNSFLGDIYVNPDIPAKEVPSTLVHEGGHAYYWGRSNPKVLPLNNPRPHFLYSEPRLVPDEAIRRLQLSKAPVFNTRGFLPEAEWNDEAYARYLVDRLYEGQDPSLWYNAGTLSDPEINKWWELPR